MCSKYACHKRRMLVLGLAGKVRGAWEQERDRKQEREREQIQAQEHERRQGEDSKG